MKNGFTLFFVALSLFSASAIAIPNPAAVNCTKNDLTYVLIQNTGICIFSDGSYCEEWSYLRNTCHSGQNKFPGGKFIPNKVAEYCVVNEEDVTHTTITGTKVILCN